MRRRFAIILLLVVTYVWGAMTVYKEIFSGLQGNLPLPPSPFSEEKISRSPRTTTSQILQIFRWLIATLNDVSNIQPETPQGAAIPSRCNCA